MCTIERASLIVFSSTNRTRDDEMLLLVPLSEDGREQPQGHHEGGVKNSRSNPVGSISVPYIIQEVLNPLFEKIEM